MEPCNLILKYSVCWVLIVSVLSQAYTSRCCVEHEKVALLQLKSYFMSISTSRNFTKFLSKELSSWEGNCSDWVRASWHEGSTQHVTYLDLSSLMNGDVINDQFVYNGKTSALNVSFFQAFGQLTDLDLSNNGISGFVGNGGYNTLNLTKLERLTFTSNALEQQEFGNLVGSLTSLQSLELRDNNAVLGNFPGRELAHLKNLVTLQMTNNGLYGSVLGQDLAQLKKLEDLDLTYNNLNGSLLGEGICNLRKLANLVLGTNALKGSIPKCLWNSTSLEYLDLSNNMFSGDLPQLIKLPSLNALSIKGNSFQGRVSLCLLVNHSRLLEDLDLSNNIALQVEIGDSLCSFASQLHILRLGRCNLGGQSDTFQKFLSNQSTLSTLDLSNNGLTGSFPKWLLQNFPYLEYLSLRNNSIEGGLELPKNMTTLSMFYLDVSSNNLIGEIPKDIGMIVDRFAFLNMSHNSFEGRIPTTLGRHSMQLDTLDLSSNHLVGEVPRKLFSQGSYLRFLVLSNNYLQGEIIPSYTNLPNLEVLYLDNNYFGGTIKGLLGIRTSLELFDISNNKATGELPSWIGDLEELKSMSLAGNEFHGDIPSQLCKLESLEFLDLSKNRFTGGIPSNCVRLVQLKFLHMHGNQLTGAIPEGLARLTSLVTLDLSNNHLSGGIPQWIDQLSNLVILLLGGNQLGGELPNQLCLLEHVNIINLSSNDISGSIPTCFRNLSFGVPEPYTLYHSSVIELGDDAWTAYVPSSSMATVDMRQEEVEFIVKSKYSSYKGKILSIMSELDLSNNKLAGEIPPELGELGEINALNLSYNRLSGSIPTSFSKLRSIESLDLSSNNLSGAIPSELVDLNFLEIFNVSYNNLSEQVPETGGQFGTFDERNYRGNPLLCGSRLPTSCKNDVPSAPTQVTSSEEGDSGFDMEAFFWSFGVSAVIVFLAINGVLAINPYWRRAWFAFLDVKVLWWFHP